MLNFDQAKRIALEELTEIVSVKFLSFKDRKIAGLERYSDIFLIVTEVFITVDVVKPLTLLMALPDGFPIVLPKLYLSKDDQKWIGFIPHVSVNGFICIYDEESITVDCEQPGKLAKECLHKAIQIVEQGIQGKNRNDFSDEFVSYWNETYCGKDVILRCLNMLEYCPPNKPCLINFLVIKGTFCGYQSILYDHGKYIDRFRGYLNERGYVISEAEGLYVGTISKMFPPFNFINADLYRFIRDHFPDSKEEFEKYINKSSTYRMILFSIVVENAHLFFGFYISELTILRKGFRNGILSPLKVFKDLQRNSPVIRLQFDTYTKDRMEKRTNGIGVTGQYTITFAGVGSIGSNLIAKLLPIGIDTLHLIDPELLVLANINRHILGPESIGKPKVEELRNFLIQTNPFIEIVAHKESIVRYMRTKKEELNRSNYLFVVVGKSAVENYILQALNEIELSVPTFFIWIEPYLIGGHCLYLQPGNLFTYDDLYHNHLFKYNVIDESVYKDKDNEILLSEAGCQGSYMPYGQKSITLFLSAMLPYIYQIIENKDERNLVLNWKGKAPEGVSLGLSDYGKKLTSECIQQSEL